MEGTAVETQAAVAREAGAPFSIETLRIEPPRANEVLVEIAGVGLCHTDLVFRDQFVPYPLPAVLGHEGAGIVRAVGSDVDHVAPGDSVVVGFSSCGHCSRCEAELPSYCREFTALNYAGARPDGTSALVDQDDAVVASHFFGQSSFAGLAIANERSVVKVDATGLDLKILGTLGCGFQTGAGSVMRAFDCPRGASLTVFGGGPVGLAAVMAAAYRGCDPIIVVEPHASRRAVALELGATHAIDPAAGDVGGDVAGAVRAIVPDCCDFVLETSGREDVMATGLGVLASHGTLGLVGVPKTADVSLCVNVAGMITFGQRVIGIVEGDSDMHGFIPELIALHREGHFPFDRLCTCFPLSGINQAIEQQAQGACIKAVLVP